jgi:hypothetical protein
LERDAIRSKTDTAMTNEALCKVLCHNLCCLIQSHYFYSGRYFDAARGLDTIGKVALERRTGSSSDHAA